VGARVMSHAAPGEVLACSVSRARAAIAGSFGENEGEPLGWTFRPSRWRAIG
jgi:hypothetical protein